ncbi:hypothetical protein Golomagni_04831 [Golovinomyces magnicellulatus]|nr:hypothetical protein Golomagni_04831 [Golovinomyces magnicellulatus]
MNSLNLLSGRAPQSPGPSRSNSYGNIFSSVTTKDTRKSLREVTLNENTKDSDISKRYEASGELLNEDSSPPESHINQISTTQESGWIITSKGVLFSLFRSTRWIISTLLAPGVYIIASLHNEKGRFAPVSQIAKFGMILCSSSRQATTAQVFGLSPQNDVGLIAPDSDQEKQQSISEFSHRNRHKSSHSDAISTARFSSQPKSRDIDSSHHRKYRKIHSAPTRDTTSNSSVIRTSEVTLSSLKSPVSPASSSLRIKYPNAPAPPRPLIPRRQPFNCQPDGNNKRLMQKTLILDLDETLIHSMAKGGRMNSGYMVEVKLNTIVTAGRNPALGSKHPILYWVNKRPHCDDFLRLVCKWYNLIIFTASVQEYADPVIDLLEQERKLFSGRYYRQHCTYRQGAFIKDLSFIEPDLSKVMILDNSPFSYMFQQENAIPIGGWINDPTDNDLLHLMPLLESLQYVTDVRAFLALRGGEDGKRL